MRIRISGTNASKDWRKFKKIIDDILEYSMYRGFNSSTLRQLNGPQSATIHVFSDSFVPDNIENSKFLNELRLCFPDVDFDFE